MAAPIQVAGRKLWQTLSSIKTGVILLIIVVVVSAAGTLILQRPMTDPDDMQRAYSPQMLRLLDALGLTNVFHAWWFLLLLVLVSLSIVAASFQRFPNSWRYFSRPYKSPDKSFRRALPLQASIPMIAESQATPAADRILRKFGYKPQRVERPDHVSLFAERGRMSEMAVYIVHASLLLIFLGGIVDGLLGWRGSVRFSPGQQLTQVELTGGGVKNLGFTLRCDGAGQENYADGSPRKWWSKLTVVEAGRETLRKEIVVNDPLVYRGVRFYQSSYGMTGSVDRLVLDASRSDGQGPHQEVTLRDSDTAQLDADTTVRMAEFIPDYVVRDGQVYARSASIENPAARLVVEDKKSGKAFDFWLPAIPDVEHNAASPYKFEAKDLKMANFTGLEVSHEPGQWFVWAGVVLMGLGLALVFYFVHTRVWIAPVVDANGQWRLWIGGEANKNKHAFEQRFRKLVQEIESEVRIRPVPRVSAPEEELAGAIR